MTTNGTQSSVRTIFLVIWSSLILVTSSSRPALNVNSIMAQKTPACRKELNRLPCLHTTRHSGTLMGMLLFKWRLPYSNFKGRRWHGSLSTSANCWTTATVMKPRDPKRWTIYPSTRYLLRPPRISKLS